MLFISSLHSDLKYEDKRVTHIISTNRVTYIQHDTHTKLDYQRLIYPPRISSLTPVPEGQTPKGAGLMGLIKLDR